ncbi:hypothetical protein [Negadavirga shengliensis]|uniref:Uncharacterized protein n=1 Tax=Negadavirga shengliensis TaxID=1389218 RepID=A0ABV9T0F7_9BACT
MKTQNNKERKLPTTKIDGTAFLVDVEKNELREKANPENVISIFDLHDGANEYAFEFDRNTRNLAMSWTPEKDTLDITIPPLTKLDPEGMAQKYGYRVQDIKDKSDYEVMVNQKVLAERLSGRLNTVDIMGHTFYVDIPMDCLRPKDDFSTLGINFSEIEHHLSDDGKTYQIPYNPQTHEFHELDFGNITSIPKGVYLIEFPCAQQLDPVGYARQHGLEMQMCLKETPIRGHFAARVIDWQDTLVPKLIRENQAGRRKEKQQKRRPPHKRKGRGMG